jgi:hypothetical protein
LSAVVPQPLLNATAESGSSELLLLLAVTASGPVPVTVKEIAVADDPSVMLCDASAVTVTPGAAGLVTVIVPLTDAVRLAASATMTVTIELPIWPMLGVTEIVHAVVDVPQVDGAIVTPAVPEAANDAGIND